MDFSPGFLYFLRYSPRLLAPPVLVYILHTIFRTNFGIVIPTYVAVLLYILSLPAAFILTILYHGYVNEREAAARGAVLPPIVKCRWPGGLDLLAAVVEDFKDGYPGESLLRWSQDYGNTYNTKIMFENRIFTCEPEHIKAILATQFDSFERGPEALFRNQSLLGTGVFNSDGDMWKFHRAITRPFFSKERISDFEIFERHSADAIGQLKARLAEGYPVDFQDLVSRFTLDSATDFLFGNDVRSLSAGLPYPPSTSLGQSTSSNSHPANVFAHAFLEAQIITALRTRYGHNWPLAEFWVDEVKRYRAVVDKYIDPILDDAISKNRTMKQGSGDIEKAGVPRDKEMESGTLLDYLVKQTEDISIIRDEILNIMIAGRDTTAATLTFAIYMLAEHPAIFQRVREEILSRVGTFRQPTYEDLREMKFLRAVINETLRLYPPVPFNVRTTSKATLWHSKIPGRKPFYIPAHTRTPYSVFLMHRRTDLWGPDALEFDPDRFLDERLGKHLTPNPFIFLPFNAGPRICLGQQFAYNETAFFIARLLQSVSAITLAPDAQPPASQPPTSWAEAGGYKSKEKVWPKSHLTIYVSEGLWVRMEQASAISSV